MTFESDDDMQKKWKAFTKKIDIQMDVFSMILKSISNFLSEPYTAVMNGQVFEKYWKANVGKWNIPS